jgi:thiamine-phosphate pyrophosphorylase
MRLKKKFLKDATLYLILDTAVHPYRELLPVARQALKGGVQVFQLRDKTGSARDILHFSRKIMPYLKDKALYIINDRVDLALLLEADGVHVGQDDIPLTDVRRLTQRKLLVGVSCQSLTHIQAAVRDGADYIGLGSVFKTKTKPDRSPMDVRLLKSAAGVADVPIFPIGGIGQKNICAILKQGLRRAAICRAISTAPDVTKAAQSFRQTLDHASL